MEHRFQLHDLEPHEVWLLLGNLLLIAGSSAISIGTLLRITASGSIGDYETGQPGGIHASVVYRPGDFSMNGN